MTTKIATCCYCGNKAALVLRGKSRHELSCSTCGAPLRAMKKLRSDAAPVTENTGKAKSTDHRKRPEQRPPKRPKKYKKWRKTKDFLREVFEDVWDEIEDIFD
ncbi:hypothetical protein [Yoonia sp. 2307UL14-13]|uniref:hypothetical protein n=1 Tax=Yoonia sp. 2307UL14-13 TaxID=3126506 RepID=UPI0030AE9228